MRQPSYLALAAALLPSVLGWAKSPALPEVTEGRMLSSKGGALIDVPLKHTDVWIRVEGNVADVAVTQTFHNPFDRTIEAVYLFPLPTRAAVIEMEISTPTATVVGQLRRREDAEATYTRAREQGLVAALLTQERDNLFTQHVANIEPGVEVRVWLRYVEQLQYDDGGYELVFPMVAGPRYLPAAAANSEAARAVQPTVLPPGLRSSHDIGLAVDIDAGVPIQGIRSPSHEIVIAPTSHSLHQASVELSPEDTIPNRDFVLRYQVAGEAPALALLTQHDGSQGSFMLIAQPPAEVAPWQLAPRELVIALDTSSSMAGAPLAKAKELVRRLLQGLRPEDTFQLISFSDRVSALGELPIASKDRNVGYALDWVDGLAARGGTEMADGLERALAVPRDPGRLRLVILVSDGYIGNEDEILQQAQAGLGEARLFAFGIGAAVNRYLLEELAALGRGAAQVVRPDEPTAPAVERFFARIDKPLLTDLQIDWGGLWVEDLTPAALPDLFAGCPLVLSGHYLRGGEGTVMVSGYQAGQPVAFDLRVRLPDEPHGSPAVASLWARRRIQELSRQLLRSGDPALREQIVELALGHKLMTRYTAFVAVDTSRATDGQAATRVEVPVEVPQFVQARAITGYGSAGGGLGLMGTAGGFGGLGLMGVGNGGAGMSASLGGIGLSKDGAGGYGAINLGGRGKSASTTAPVAIQLATPVVVGGLDRNDILRHLEGARAQVRAAYEKRLREKPELEGRLTVRFVIAADGHVQSAEVSADSTQDAALKTAVLEIIRQVVFPAIAGAGEVVVNFPFVFKRAQEE